MLTFIPTPIGNLRDITPRKIEAIKISTIVICEDTRVAKRLIVILQDEFKVKFNQKQYISMHSHNENNKLKTLNMEIFKQNVIYMSDAGMPCISDPGAQLVDFAQKNNIEYDFLPGPSAGVTAYAMSGFIQTQFKFFGFLPHKTQMRKELLQEIITSSTNTILYESPHRIKQLLDEIISISFDVEVFVAKELTKLHQFTKRGLIKDVKNSITNFKGEWIVIIKPIKRKTITITQSQILNMDIPPKIKAKILSQSDNKTTKEWYNYILNNY